MFLAPGVDTTPRNAEQPLTYLRRMASIADGYLPPLRTIVGLIVDGADAETDRLKLSITEAIAACQSTRDIFWASVRVEAIARYGLAIVPVVIRLPS